MLILRTETSGCASLASVYCTVNATTVLVLRALRLVLIHVDVSSRNLRSFVEQRRHLNTLFLHPIDISMMSTEPLSLGCP